MHANFSRKRTSRARPAGGRDCPRGPHAAPVVRDYDGRVWFTAANCEVHSCSRSTRLRRSTGAPKNSARDDGLPAAVARAIRRSDGAAGVGRKMLCRTRRARTAPHAAAAAALLLLQCACAQLLCATPDGSTPDTSGLNDASRLRDCRRRRLMRYQLQPCGARAYAPPTRLRMCTQTRRPRPAPSPATRRSGTRAPATSSPLAR